MSFSHLLDTSVLSQPLKERPLRSVQRRWTPERSGQFCTSAICHAELLRGLEERCSAKLWLRYNDLLQTEIAVVAFGLEAAKVYGKLCARLFAAGSRRDVADLLIAAAALSSGLTLATLNAAHFAGIDDLRVEDWLQ